jgi:putative transposase
MRCGDKLRFHLSPKVRGACCRVLRYMARLPRAVLPGCWHHVTQRGNHRQTVFFDDSQRKFYLELLRLHCERYRVGIGGYCLMGNHVHVLAVPSSEDGLASAFGRTHNEYARWLHLHQGMGGHLWQNRFYSCPLDEGGRWAALRYVELNPVRAGLVRQAGDWRWSSAWAHLIERDASGMLAWNEWGQAWSADTWNSALKGGVEFADLEARLRKATATGRPLGSAEFVQHAEAVLGRPLAPKRPGPKPKSRI